MASTPDESRTEIESNQSSMGSCRCRLNEVVSDWLFLFDLDSDLTDKIWPPTRVVLGLCVSKRLQCVLGAAAGNVIFLRRYFRQKRDDNDIEIALGATLSRFSRKPQIHVCMQHCCALMPSLLRGIESAALEGNLDQLATLDLGSMFPRREFRIPSAVFQSCAGLTQLNLSSWKVAADITSLCLSLASCTRLQHLDLSKADLKGDAGVTIAALLGKLGTVTHLNLACNYLALPALLAGCSSLTFLDFSLNANKAGAEDHALHVACTALGTLNLNGTTLTGTVPLHDIVRVCGELQCLDLRRSNLGEGALCAVLQTIAACSSGLTSLNLSHLGLGHFSKQRVLQDLTACSTLRDLSLQSSSMGAMLDHALAAHPAQPLSQLTRLDLKSTVRTGPVCDLDALARRLPMLEAIDIGGLELDPSRNVLGRAVGEWPRLRELRADDISLETHGMAGLVEGLGHCPGLRELSLQHNGIGAAGVQHLCTALAQPPGLRQLERLDLVGNHMLDEGVSLLAAGLAVHCPGLQYLAVCINSFGPAGATALAEVLPLLPALQDLRLGSNLITAAGAEALGQSVGGSGTLESLDVSRCRLQDAATASIIEGVRRCRSIRRLDVSDNSLSAGPGKATSLSVAAIQALPDHVRVSPLILGTP